LRFLALRFVFFGAAAFLAFLRFAIVPSKLEMALSKTCCRESTARRFDYYRTQKTATPLNETCTCCARDERFDASSMQHSRSSHRARESVAIIFAHSMRHHICIDRIRVICVSAKTGMHRFARNASTRARNFNACGVKPHVALRLEKFFSVKHRNPALET